MRPHNSIAMGSLRGARRLASFQATILLFSALAVASAWGCGGRGGVFGDPGDGAGGAGGTGGAGGAGGELPPKADKVDLLLVIDNSRSMADKQEILGLAVPSLLDGLLNPSCLDANGQVVANQPTSPAGACPASSTRQFPPLTDIHFGVMTTSLGGHGADACTQGDASENDRGRLMDRGPVGTVATYEGKGFLAWDPEGQLDPPGQANAGALETNLEALVLGAGQLGCGFEATLESWYRFLVQPDPYVTIEVVDQSAVLVGTDDVLLQQRRDFVRPDSLLVVMMVSDENDCSIRDGGQYYFAAQVFQAGTTQFHLPKPRAACASDPNDPCCRSCGQSPGEGCDTTEDDCDGSLSQLEDHGNLRCWEQKRRFGIDFLYPIDRYVDGLSEDRVPDRQGNLLPNPLYQGSRDPRLVILGAMAGVPWQDLARQNAGGLPNLLSGLNAQSKPVGGFQSAAELKAKNTWALVLGDPDAYYTDPGARPTDPLMKESVDPRTGVHPLTGEAVAPPGSDTYANSINGHEYSIPDRGDLQYSCVFPLLSPRDCTNPAHIACECIDPTTDNPLCQNDAGAFGTTQYRAKAYPPLRLLQVLEATETASFLGSICPAQLQNQAVADFGYRPIVRSMLEAAAPILTP